MLPEVWIKNIISKLSIIKGALAVVLTVALLKVDVIANFFNFSDDRIKLGSVFCLALILVELFDKMRVHLVEQFFKTKKLRAKQQEQRKKEENSLNLYRSLNKRAKDIVDHCISQDIFSYGDPFDRDARHFRELIVKGFGKSDCIHGIIFDGETFKDIYEFKSEAIKASYEAGESEYAA